MLGQVSISGEGLWLKMVLSSRRNAHFEEKWCSRRGETLDFAFLGALGFKSGALVEAKRSFSLFGLFLSSLGLRLQAKNGVFVEAKRSR